jgi:hypothetical protein
VRLDQVVPGVRRGHGGGVTPGGVPIVRVSSKPGAVQSRWLSLVAFGVPTLVTTASFARASRSRIIDPLVVIPLAIQYALFLWFALSVSVRLPAQD